MSRLSDAVKAKYPQYANIPDEQLDAKIIERFPQYASMGYVPRSIPQYGKNIVNSGINTATGVAKSVANVFNPNLEDNTVVNLGKLVYDTGKYQPFAGEKANEGNKFQQLLNFYKERYGGPERILTTAYEDPVGMMLDASTLISGAGGVAKFAGRAGGLANLTKAGEVASAVGAGADPVALPFRGMAAAAKKVPTSNVFKKLGAGLEKSGEQTMTRGLGNPAEQAKFKQRYGQSFGDFMDEYGLQDRSPEAATAAKKTILNSYDDLALNSGKQVGIGEVVKAIDDKINEMQSGPGQYSDNANAQIAELLRRKQQLLEYAGGTAESSPIYVGVDKLTQFRREAIDPDLPQSTFALDSHAAGKAAGAKGTRDILRKTINSTDPKLEKLGLDYGKAKTAEKIFNSAAARTQNRQIFGLGTATKAITGGAVYGLPGVVGGIAADVVMNNPRVLSAVSKGLKSSGRALQTNDVRLPNIPAVGKIGGAVYNTGKAGYVTTPRAGTTLQGQSTLSEQQRRLASLGQNPQGSQTRSPYASSISNPPPSSTAQSGMIDPKSFYTAPKVPKITTNIAFGKTKKLKRSSAY